MQKNKNMRHRRVIWFALLLVALLVFGTMVACENQPADELPTGEETQGGEVTPTSPVDSNIAEPGTEDSQDTQTVAPVVTDEAGNVVTTPETSTPNETQGAIDNEPVTLPPVIDLPSDSGSNGDNEDTKEEATEAETVSPELHPGDSSKYKGVMISAVYGTGKKNTDAAAEAGFVQLYNSNNKAVSLKGASLYYKSDGAKPYSQFVFPEDAVIPAKGYYLVRCNPVAGYDAAYAVIGVEYYDVQWDETLDNKEIRLLMAPTGWTISRDDDILSFNDAISVFYASDIDISNDIYAVDNLSKNKVAVRTALKDYSGFHKVNLTERATAELQQVAPVTSDGRVNKVIASRLKEVYFSAPAGVYDSTFSLTLSAETGSSIYYTTDGSDPTTSSTRKKYTAAISLKDTSAVTWGPTIKAWNNWNGSATPASSTLPGAYVIKAYATNGFTTTPVYTNTYFINDDLLDYGVSVVSLSLPVSNMIGNEGFYSNILLTPGGHITSGRRRSDAVMEVFDINGDRVGHSNVEIAVSGNGSSGHTMKSLRVFYKSANNLEGGMEPDLEYDLFNGRAKDVNGNVITTFDRLILRNSGNDCLNSYIRDAYMQRVAANTNVGTMASATIFVFFNGEFWGVYNARERYTASYAESHYGVDKENVAMIESDYYKLTAEGDPAAPYIDTDGVTGYAADFNDLVAYMNSHNLADPDAYAAVCARMDIDSFMDMWVVRCFFNARDWPENNMKVWRNTNPDDPSGVDSRWYFNLLDLDMGIAYFPHGDPNDTSEYQHFMQHFIGSNSVCAQMMRSLLDNQAFKEKFICRYYEVVTEIFTPEYLSAVLEDMVAERVPLMQLQVNRWGHAGASISTWNSDINDMRSFIKNRQALTLDFLYRYFGTSAEEIENMSSRRVTISYNDTRADVTVNGQTYASGTLFRFEQASYLFEVDATAKEGYEISAIVFMANNGQTQRVEGKNTATFTVTTSGTISVVTRRTRTDGVNTGNIYAGAHSMYFLTDSGELYAWGDNQNGILGMANMGTTVSTPVLVMDNVAKFSTTHSADVENGSTNFSIAILTTDGKLYTAGANGAGQLGRNGVAASSTLGIVNFDGKIVDVQMGYDHMVVLDDKGQMWGVGSNSYGQLGTKNAGGNASTFQLVVSNVAQMAAGRRNTLYIDKSGNLWGLGDNRWGKLSASHGDSIASPVKMLSKVTYVSCGEHQMVAVTEAGELYYAGWRKLDSFVNDGSKNNPVLQKFNIKDVVKADLYHSNLVILTKNGDAYVYGSNMDGGIGSSAVTGGTPKKIYSDVVDIAAGYGFTAYLCKDGYIRILGSNISGQAGNGTVGGYVDFTEADI